jgi:hypothetical protein
VLILSRATQRCQVTLYNNLNAGVFPKHLEFAICNCRYRYWKGVSYLDFANSGARLGEHIRTLSLKSLPWI